jgi:hypothetical protein
LYIKYSQGFRKVNSIKSITENRKNNRYRNKITNQKHRIRRLTCFLTLGTFSEKGLIVGIVLSLLKDMKLIVYA